MAAETSNYIKKKKQGDDLFSHFHKEGLDLLQMLSGDVWTDYNEHDPGVTILENISYALTELDYKANLPVKDLLIQKDGAKLSSGDNGMYIASDILTTSPVTVLDYRKLFYDQISNVKNVWMEIVDNADDLNNMKGLYNIYVEMYSYNFTGPDLTKEQDRIKTEVRKLYNSHRNFCQDLLHIVILNPLRLKLKFNILLLNNANAESVLANIFYKTVAIVTNQINYYSLDELQKKGLPIEQIYDGPYLDYGFILDSDLKERCNKIVFEDIIKVISKINGIARINSFSLIPFDDSQTGPDIIFTDHYVRFPDMYSPNVSFPDTIEDIHFYYNTIPFKVDLKETSNILADMQAEDYNRFRTVSQQMNEIDIPAGVYTNVESYLPVRNQFPLTYGIGAFELPEKVFPPQRYAQAKQLKAFLFPFDQIMANYLKQLSALNTLYSDGPDKDLGSKSYYSQKLQDMDTLSYLFDKGTTHADKSWEGILEKISEQYDKQAIDRLNDIADNILARYSERFNTYALQKINDICYGENSHYTDFKINLLKWKRKLISQYGLISRNRGRGYDCVGYQESELAAEGADDIQNKIIPGLIRKITILMGIENCAMRPLSTVISNTGITIFERLQKHQFISEDIALIFPEIGTGILESEDLLLINQDVDTYRNSLLFPGNKKHLFNDVLKNGVLRTNYSIKKDTDPDQNKYYILFKSDAGTHLMHIAPSEEEAEKTIDKTIRYLCRLNTDSEGMFLLEHILLTPPYYENYFGFRAEVHSSASDKPIVFMEAQKQPLSERNADALFVRQYSTNKEKLRIDQNSTKRGLVLELKNDSGKVIAVSEKSFSDQADLDQMKKELSALLYDTSDTVSVDINFLSYYGEEVVDESFFSFQMSFILPDWPARFQTEIFQHKLTHLIHEHAPVHVLSDMHWWSINEMADFEELYYDWVKLLTDETNTTDIIPYSYKLIQMLQQSKQKQKRHS